MRSWTFSSGANAKDLLVRIVAMLTRMIERGNQVCEQESVYGNGNEYENEDDLGQSGTGDPPRLAPEP